MNGIKELVIPGYESVSEISLSMNNSLETIVISEGTKKINGYNGTIGSNCKKLKQVFFPMSVDDISTKNVGSLAKTEWCVYENSYAQKYAESNGYPYTVVKPITSVVLSEQILNLNVGKGTALKASIEPKDATSQKVQWMSTDEKIATVDAKGKIKAVGAGECDIICRGVDCGAVTALCHVKAIIPLQGLSVKEKKMNVMASEAFIPEIIYKPENATNQEVVFTSSDESVVRVMEDGGLMAVSDGKAVITVASTDGSNKKTTFSVEVSRKIGKYEGPVFFQGLEWGMDYKTCVQKLREGGMMASNDGAFERARNNMFHFWPDNVNKFTNIRMWTDLPLELEREGGGYLAFAPLQKTAGYPARDISLSFLSHINEDGSLEPEKTELISACIIMYATDYNKRLIDVFKDVLTEYEAKYGSFIIYTPQNLNKWSINGVKVIDEVPELYKVANYYSTKEPFADAYNGECPHNGILCVLYGTEDTGIMIWFEESMVAILYGKTDASEQIKKIEKSLK